MFERCSHCVELHANGDFEAANHCWQCKGKGFCRKPESYLCNKCGERMTNSFDVHDNNVYGLVETSVSGGYASPHLFDMTSYIFSLCEKCLRNLFGECKIPPRVSGEGNSYAEDLADYEIRSRSGR